MNHNAFRLQINYQQQRNHSVPFPNPSLLDSADENDKETVKTSVDVMLQAATTAGLPDVYLNDLQSIVYGILDQFRIHFCGQAANVPPLQIKLYPHAKLVHAKL